ncbi:MAG: cadherin domain-containing protein [Anaerolineales bacterium]|nr:cadherin domain-containing protein [Anaerolineales bacterium]
MNASLSFKGNTRILLTAIGITILLTATSALAASGTLDTTFGTNGIVTTQFNNLPSSANEVLLQTDGKIIILGTIKLSDGQFKKIIARYNSNGTLDTLFGDNGKILIEIASFSGSKIALQPDGKLIVGGLSGGKFAVVRYNSNGTQDTTFGTNGMGNVRFFSEARQSLADMMIQFDGKIVMVGDHTLGQSNFTDLFIARFNSNGTPDETFVANGFNIIDDTYFPNNRYNYGKAGFIQPDGKIIILGNMMDNDGKNQLSMARINQDGSLDTSTFGTNGKGTATFAFTNFQSYNMTVQTDGKIIVLAAKDGNVALVRCNSNGTLDTSFGGTGIMTTDFGGEEQADDLVIQSDGKIIIEGKTSGLYSSDFLLVRYNRDGSLDTTFGANGKVITDFGSSDDTATGIALQPDNKVIIVGTSGENAIMARYEAGTSSVTQTSDTFKSADAYDGWILESGEKTNKGGILDKTASIINLGDDSKDRQYRGILSFNTISIPDDALITSAQVKIKRQGFVGTSAFKTHGNLLMDIRTGTFSNNVILKVEDFSAIANIGSSQEKFSESPLNWYTASLSNTNLAFINKYGITQIRLLFSKDDNDDMGADYIKFFSGSAASSDQPQLIVTYSSNSGGTNSGNQPPVIISNGGQATAGINIAENSTAVTTVIATDTEAVTYSILGGQDSALFSITTDTGLLTLVTAPDYEALSLGTIYHVTVQASDGSLMASQDIAVTVTNVNEYAPEITSNANISLPEKSAEVTVITASDADLQTITYSIIGGTNAALFSLNPSDGKLSFVTAPSYIFDDASVDNTYHVTVQASDGALNDQQEISVRILNPNNTSGITFLHEFGGQQNNGRIPYGTLLLYNDFLYGTTTYGGPPYNVPPTNPANKGNVFRVKRDGTDFTVLHEFTGGTNDGWKPWSGLAIANDMIFGSTVYGGPRGEGGGVIYEMNINGSGFRVLHAFGEPGDGFGGSTSPILVDDTLYGLTRWGGNGTGTVYSYNTSTEVYTQLYRFAANSSDGNAPLGTLTAANDGYLYGLTWLGGKNNMGTLFRIKPDGSAFETLHHFAGGTQGKYPYDTLVFDGNHTLYGTTLGEYGNNPSDLGTVFKYDLANKTHTVLHKFAGGINDSGKPNGGVVLSLDGWTLYGTTHGDDAWGGKEYGILYQMYIDGAGFQKLYEFSGGIAGATPMRTPLLLDGVLYGMTAYGGMENYGIIWTFHIPDLRTTNPVAPAVNLHSPVITSNNAISVPENNSAAVIITATDEDLPAQALTYSITGGADSQLFHDQSIYRRFDFYRCTEL